MANKTVDRKKALPARSQAAKASPKNGSAKTTRPSATSPVTSSDRKPEKSAVLEVEEVEREEVVEEEEETDEEEVEVVEDEDEDEEEAVEVDEDEEVEEVVEEKPARRSYAKAKKERDLVTTSPQDYRITRSTRASRFQKIPGAQFVRASYRELRLVTWPSRHDTWTWSVVVVCVCIAIAILLGAADLGFTQFVNWWLSLAH